MKIERIDPSEIPGRVSGGMGMAPSEESAAVLALGIGEAVKFACRWNHNPQLPGHESYVRACEKACRTGAG